MSSESAVRVAVRPMGPEDINFAIKSHLLTLRHSSPVSWFVENPDFFEGEQKTIKRVMARQSCRGLVAGPEGDPELVLGFVLFEPGVLHSLYVKAAFRRQGIAKALLQAANLDPVQGFVSGIAVHDSTKGWLKQKYPAVRFNPYVRSET